MMAPMRFFFEVYWYRPDWAVSLALFWHPYGSVLLFVLGLGLGRAVGYLRLK